MSTLLLLYVLGMCPSTAEPVWDQGTGTFVCIDTLRDTQAAIPVVLPVLRPKHRHVAQ